METRAEVYGNAAGLLLRLGFAARVDPAYTPAGQTKALVALVTSAPPVLVGHAISQVATDPEPHLPTTSVRIPNPVKGKPGDPLHVWWP